MWTTLQLLLLLPSTVSMLYRTAAIVFVVGFRESYWSQVGPRLLFPCLWWLLMINAFLFDCVQSSPVRVVTAKLLSYSMVLIILGTGLLTAYLFRQGLPTVAETAVPLVVPLFLTDWLVSACMIYRTHQDTIVGPAVVALDRNEPVLSNQVVLITGANAGIGWETAQQVYLRSDASTILILACRSLERAQQARRAIIECAETKLPSNKRMGEIKILPLDLTSLVSIRRAIATLQEWFGTETTISVLINNAGMISGSSCVLCEETGVEVTMQANHVGPYYFTRLLLQNELLTSTALILNVSSCTYALLSHLPVDTEADVQELLCCRREDGTYVYSYTTQYTRSKLANLLFTLQLRHELLDTNMRVYAIHPGVVRTQVTKNLPPLIQLLNTTFAAIIGWFQKTPKQGAACTMSVVTRYLNETKDRAEDLYAYYHVNGEVQELRACAKDNERAQRLWEVSAKLTGLPP